MTLNHLNCVFVFETVTLSVINRNVEIFSVSVRAHSLRNASWTVVWEGTQHRITAPVYQATSEYAALKVSVTKRTAHYKIVQMTA